MNRQEHLLLILSEECVEVAHAVSKSLRFGLDDYWNDKPINKDQISQEMGDLFGIYFMLLKEGFINAPAQSLINDKQIKVEKYLLYSKEKGTLTNE